MPKTIDTIEFLHDIAKALGPGHEVVFRGGTSYGALLLKVNLADGRTLAFRQGDEPGDYSVKAYNGHRDEFGDGHNCETIHGKTCEVCKGPAEARFFYYVASRLGAPHRKEEGNAILCHGCFKNVWGSDV